AAALDDPSAATPAMTRGRRGVPDGGRFAVYRNNVAVGMIGAIEARYPVSRRLVCDDLFRAMARAFAHAHKPRSPVMIAYGEDFPAFAAAYLAAAQGTPGLRARAGRGAGGPRRAGRRGAARERMGRGLPRRRRSGGGGRRTRRAEPRLSARNAD